MSRVVSGVVVGVSERMAEVRREVDSIECGRRVRIERAWVSLRASRRGSWSGEEAEEDGGGGKKEFLRMRRSDGERHATRRGVREACVIGLVAWWRRGDGERMLLDGLGGVEVELRLCDTEILVELKSYNRASAKKEIYPDQ